MRRRFLSLFLCLFLLALLLFRWLLLARALVAALLRGRLLLRSRLLLRFGLLALLHQLEDRHRGVVANPILDVHDPRVPPPPLLAPGPDPLEQLGGRRLIGPRLWPDPP